MREHVGRDKKTTTGFSIPSLKHPVRGFGLDSSEATDGDNTTCEIGVVKGGDDIIKVTHFKKL